MQNGQRLRREVVMRDDMDEVPIVAIGHTEQGVAERHGASQDGVVHRLEVGWRAADDSEDLAGRGLLVQGLGKFAVSRLQLVK